MYNNILVPLDGSDIAEAILPYARSLAKRLVVSVELLMAIEPETIKTFTDPVRGRFVDAVEGDMKRNGLAYLEKIADSFRGLATVACRVEIAAPAEAIINRASSPDTLIAMATHGRAGIQRWLLGSVADKILHGSPNPLFLVRPQKGLSETGEINLKSIVVPLDGSLLAENALPAATHLARTMDLEIILLRAYDLPTSAFYGEDAYVPNVEAMINQIRSEVQGYLETKQTALRGHGVKDVSIIVLQGDPSTQIIEYAGTGTNSFIAMCTHGRSGVGRWILGSVTDRVVRHTTNPVLVIRS